MSTLRIGLVASAIGAALTVLSVLDPAGPLLLLLGALGAAIGMERFVPSAPSVAEATSEPLVLGPTPDETGVVDDRVA